jgi:uncharacterized protein YdhG (YjbR/CyaY superfamily)
VGDASDEPGGKRHRRLPGRAPPKDQRSALEKLRKTIKAAAPQAAESISYAIPTFKYKGKPLIYFGAAKNQCAIYGGINIGAHKEELKDYDAAKGTIRFLPGKPVPPALVKLVKDRMAEIDAGARGYETRRKEGEGLGLRIRKEDSFSWWLSWI